MELRGEPDSGILSSGALDFVADLQRAFGGRREELLAARAARQQRLLDGELPDFLEGTREIRDSEWQVAEAPPDLQDRRVEITGPTDRKMVINALNSGARVFMADFEDANSPTWSNLVEGQPNLIDANEQTISLDTGEKSYRLNDEVATLLVRPRGWHLPERHLLVDGEPVSGSLFDFGLYMFHSAGGRSHAAAGRTSTCRRWRAISRRGCGTTSSCTRRTRSGFRGGRSAPPS